MEDYLFQTKEVFELMESPFVVFGAGSVGKRFIEIIKKRGYLDNLVGVGISNASDGDSIGDIPVRSIESFDRCLPVFIAVHESSYSVVNSYLERLEFKKYMWIYPMFCNLFFGKPVKRNVKIDVGSLFTTSNRIFNYAVYALVIEQLMGNISNGFAIYTKYFTTLSTEKSAEERLRSFKERVIRSSKTGFIQETPIRVSVDKARILDGVHRCVLSFYYGNHVIFADLYKVTDEAYSIYSNNHILTRERMEEIYDSSEIRLIEEQFHRMISEIDHNNCLQYRNRDVIA